MKKNIEEIEALTEEFRDFPILESPSWNTKTSCLHALSNVIITPREVIVTADLPKIDINTINIKKKDENFIQITARLKKKVTFIDLGIYHRQGIFSFLRCQNRVHVSFNLEKMRISYEDGILEVRFPRKDKNQTENS
jgi:HSP20 family molecular chaperone IbpA